MTTKERRPLLTDTSSDDTDSSTILDNDVRQLSEFPESAESEPLPSWPLACLLLQHLSNTFGIAVFGFCGSFFLTVVFKDTLAPGATTGMITTASGLIFAGTVGDLVDRMQRLGFVRRAISVQKVCMAIGFGIFLVLFGPLEQIASPAIHLRVGWRDCLAVYGCVIGFILFASISHNCGQGLIVSIERDWVTAIADGNVKNLSKLNSYMKMIDQCSRVLAPLLVSLLTVNFGYWAATVILLGFVLVTWFTEYLWIMVVYNQFPSLSEETRSRQKPAPKTAPSDSHSDMPSRVRGPPLSRIRSWLRTELTGWREFANLPISLGSLAFGLTYMGTLSFDGMGLAYFKVARGFDDTLLASVRMLCVASALFGSFLQPSLERQFGTGKTAVSALWTEIIIYIPVVAMFFYPKLTPGTTGPAWNWLTIFLGIALNRITQSTFELSQIKQLQLDLEHHPSRNRLTALQQGVWSLAMFIRYFQLAILSSPGQFKWTAIVTWCGTFGAGVAYLVYLRKTRMGGVMLEV